MVSNYLITGYWGEPHVTVENDRGINAAIFGAGRFVLPVGERFRAEYIGNSTVRMYDGKLIDNGAIAGIPAGRYVDLLIPETGQGMKRNDIIAFQYSKDVSTLVESGTFVVISGAETKGTAVDPTLTQQDILSDTATFDQMPLWRVSVSSAVISEPVQLFTVCDNFGTPKTVEIHVTDNGDSLTADKTFDEILAAYNAGRTMVVSYLGYKCHLSMVEANEFIAFTVPADFGNLSVVFTSDNNVGIASEGFSYVGHKHDADEIRDGLTVFAPNGLVSAQKSASTSTQLISALREVYQTMSNDTVKIIRLSVSGSNLALPASNWFVTIYRSTDKEGYAEAVTYIDGGLRYTNVIYNGTWTGWKNRSTTAANVAQASVE